MSHVILITSSRILVISHIITASLLSSKSIEDRHEFIFTLTILIGCNVFEKHQSLQRIVMNDHYNAPYISMEMTKYQNKDDKHPNSFTAFHWLNSLITISPMWVTRNPKKEHKSLVCNVFGILHLSFILVFAIGYEVYSSYQAESVLGPLYLIMHSISDICLLCARLLSIIYYGKVFDYPWISTNDIYICNVENFQILFRIKISKTNKRIILFLMTYMFTCSIHYMGELVEDTVTFDYIWLIFWIYCLIIPIGLSQCCATLILLQYELFIHKLICLLSNQNGEINYNSMNNEYKRMTFSFEKECKFWKWYFGLKICGFCSYVWIYVSGLIHSESNIYMTLFRVVGIVFWLCPIIELVRASSNLSSAYHCFLEKLLANQENQMNVNVKQNVHDNNAILYINKLQACNHLYNYVFAHRMVFTLFGSELNVGNAIKLFIFFVIAKLISYSIYNI
eukprot:153616_1